MKTGVVTYGTASVQMSELEFGEVSCMILILVSL